MTVSISHHLEFVTELDETNPVAQRLLSQPHEFQVTMLEDMLRKLIAPQLTPILDELNAGNSYATLKVVL
jgi:hypothetical protein